MRKKNRAITDLNSWDFKFDLHGLIALLIMFCGLAYGVYWIRHCGYQKGQIDWQKGKKCVVLQTTDTGEKIYIDTCNFLK